MEVGIPQALSSLEKSFNSTSRLNIDGLKNSILDVSKLASQSKQLVELDLYNDKDDEGEIMLLAMILLQLHGVKLPTTTANQESEEEDSDLLNKKKRQRTSPDQLAILEQIFQTDKMPNQQTRVQLADQLGMSSRRVQIWFQNKRAKVKRSVSRPDGECESPDSLRSSIGSPSSPLSSSSDSSPIFSSSPAATVSPIPLQLNISESATTLASPSLPTPISAPSTPSPPATTPASIPTATPIPSFTATTSSPAIVSTATDLSTPLKFPQFSSTFVDNRPLLAASY